MAPSQVSPLLSIGAEPPADALVEPVAQRRTLQVLGHRHLRDAHDPLHDLGVQVALCPEVMVAEPAGDDGGLGDSSSDTSPYDARGTPRSPPAGSARAAPRRHALRALARRGVLLLRRGHRPADDIDRRAGTEGPLRRPRPSSCGTIGEFVACAYAIVASAVISCSLTSVHAPSLSARHSCWACVMSSPTVRTSSRWSHGGCRSCRRRRSCPAPAGPASPCRTRSRSRSRPSSPGIRARRASRVQRP